MYKSRQVFNIRHKGTFCINSYYYYNFIILKGDSGFICVKTETLLIFGSYSSSMFSSMCSEAVEKLGKFVCI